MPRYVFLVFLFTIVLVFITPTDAANLGVSLFHDFNYLHQRPELAEKIVAANIDWVKIELRMDYMEPEQDQFDWPEEEIEALHDQGLTIFASISYTPQWANGGRSKEYPCVSVADWKQFMTELVRKFDDQIDYWGIWNEPGSANFFRCDSSNCVDDYVEKILIPAAEAIRAQAGTNYIVAPQTNYENWGGVNPSGSNGVIFLEQVMQKLQAMGKLDHVDIISHHIFKVYEKGYWLNFIHYMEDTGLHDFLALYDKPFWIGDVGWQVPPDKQSERAKRYTDGLYEMFHYCGAERVFLYMFNDNQYIGEYYGMVYDGMPYVEKKHYYTVADYQVPQAEDLNFEFESDFQHQIGRVNQTGWEASTGLDSEGYLAYGPYSSDVKAGYRKAIFKISIDNNSVNNDLIAKIEVSNLDYDLPLPGPGKIIAARNIYRTNFYNHPSPTDFVLDFYHHGSEDRLEFRVYWYDKAYISIDNVRIPSLFGSNNVPVSMR